MSSSYVADATRRRVIESARRRCGYCHTQEEVVGYPLHVEHIMPVAAGGTPDEENLWLACCVCNNAKGVQTHGVDPDTGVEVPLFNVGFARPIAAERRENRRVA